MRARLLFILILLLGQPPVFADSDCTSASSDCVEVGKLQISVALGAGIRTNPVVGRKDIPLVVLPEISYTGERFFIQNLDFGAMLWENESHQFNLLVTPTYDQIFFYRWNPGNFVLETSILAQPGQGSAQSPRPDEQPETDSGFAPEITKTVDTSRLHKRRMAALAGLEYSLMLEDWDLQAQWLYDVTGVHDGSEVRLAVARHYRQQRHWLTFAVGANWQSDAMINYYYGIRPNEVALVDDAYHTGAGLSAIARVDWRYKLTDSWTLRFNTSYRHLADEISQSPLITDDKVITAFIGGVYHF